MFTVAPCTWTEGEKPFKGQNGRPGVPWFSGAAQPGLDSGDKNLHTAWSIASPVNIPGISPPRITMFISYVHEDGGIADDADAGER